MQGCICCYLIGKWINLEEAGCDIAPLFPQIHTTKASILKYCTFYPQCVTAVDGYWLAELGPMFYSVKESAKSRSEGKRLAVEQTKAMENEMKEAEAEIKRRAEAVRAKEDKERQRSVIATPGRTPLGKKTPHRFGI